MEISVREAARWLGVSERRVQMLAQSDRLSARRVSGAWLIDSACLGRHRARSRAMSPRIGQALIRLLSRPDLNAEALGIAPREVSRLRARLRGLLDDSDPASLLASWLASAEPAPVLLSAHPGDLRAVLADSRVVPSGISDPRSNLAGSDEVEGWVSRADFDGLVADHMLASEGDRNVRLHISDAPLDNPVPLGRLLADLSAHPGPREADAVHRLLHEAASAPRVLGDISDPTPATCSRQSGHRPLSDSRAGSLISQCKSGMTRRGRGVEAAPPPPRPEGFPAPRTTSCPS